MVTNEYLDRVRRCVEEVASDYRQNKANILTERDMLCQLYSRLLFAFPERLRTADVENVTGTCVHTELTFYDVKRPGHGRGVREKQIHADLTLVDMDELSVYRSEVNGRRVGKGYSFGGKPILLELKFIKSQSGVSEKRLNEIRDDFQKAVGLNRKYPNGEFYLFIVVFTKTVETHTVIQRVFNEFREVPNVEPILKCGEVWTR